MDLCEVKEEPMAGRSLQGKAILVVEDEALIAMNVESWLQDAGARDIQSVRRLSAAREALNGDSVFDAVILDLHLADGDASPLLETLQKRAIPVMVTTGDAAFLGDLPNPKLIVLDKPFSESAFISGLLRLL
jgi:DNA-binding NtrC family response regulator